MDEMEKWLRLATMVLCDPLPQKATPVYFVGETDDNRDSLYERIPRSHIEWFDPFFGETYSVFPIAVTGGETTGYSGAKSWVKRFEFYDFPEELIHVIPMDVPLNTFTEMQALVRYAERVGWNKITIIAAPFHQLRAFLSLLGAMKRLGRMNPPVLWVYNWPGLPLPWQEKALHSQGALTATREDLIGTEWKRIAEYTAKGDLVTVDEALSYLRLRDQLVS